MAAMQQGVIYKLFCSSLVFVKVLKSISIYPLFSWNVLASNFSTNFAFLLPLLVGYFGIYSHNIMPFVGAQEIGYVTQE